MTAVRTLTIVATLVFVAGTGCGRPGKEIYVREGCATCHRFRDVGRGGAPDLTDVATRRSAEWIRQQISDARVNDPASRMPAFPQLTEAEIAALVAYLR